MVWWFPFRPTLRNNHGYLFISRRLVHECLDANIAIEKSSGPKMKSAPFDPQCGPTGQFVIIDGKYRPGTINDPMKYYKHSVNCRFKMKLIQRLKEPIDINDKLKRKERYQRGNL